MTYGSSKPHALLRAFLFAGVQAPGSAAHDALHIPSVQRVAFLGLDV